MAAVRIRLIFEEEEVLSKSQRKNELKRSWVALKSNLHSISDFSSYLIDCFLLRDACPHGLTLSMDDFVLPPFEPISVLKDKDIVRVKKKDENAASADIDVRLLPNEELVKECSDNEAHEDELYDRPHQLEYTLDEGSNEKKVCRKRKALRTRHSSKIKKNRYAPATTSILAPSNFQQIQEQSVRFQQEVFSSEKSVVKKHKSSNGHTDTDYSNKKNATELQKCSSLKRDKRRKLMRKQVNAQKEKVPQKIVEKSKLADENFEDSEQLACRSDDEEVVPVVVRPGHVRFLPLGQVEVNKFVHPGQPSTDSLCLNGITIKKGQKCGKGKSSSSISNSKNCEGQSSKTKAKKGLATMNCAINFDELKPCGTLPKRGDIIAYRLIDLSSSWTPELSSFRVGKVSWCKPEANKIMLIPVRKYPFVFKKAINEESAKQVDISPYAEDGTLKADYSSLVDIRIVEQKNSIGFKEAADNNNSEASGTKQSWNKWEKHSSAPRQSWNKWETHSKAPKQSWNKWEAQSKGPKQSWKQWENNTITGEGIKENAWDEILEALNTKKANFCNDVRWRRGKEKAWEGMVHEKFTHVALLSCKVRQGESFSCL